MALMRAAEQVLRLAESLQIVLQASFIRGSLNVIADMLSRADTVLKTEWRLSLMTFSWVSDHSPWGPPTVDLFAHRFNTQLPRYISACPDVDALGVDALLTPWPREVCYAFPPSTLLQLVCVKILQDRPQTLLLIAPQTPTASWFPTLKLYSVNILPIPLDRLTLIQPHWNHCHPSPGLLSLALFLIHFPACDR